MVAIYKTCPPRAVSRRLMRGVTLIELMVGLVLGMVVVLVVAQVLSFAEGQRRATTGGADAQVNGALALYTLQREIQMAGYGLISDRNVLGCPLRAQHTATGLQNWTLTPVIINDGANGAPDSITVMSADRDPASTNTTFYTVPMPVSLDHLPTATFFTVRSALGVQVGDMVIAVPANTNFNPASNWCSAYRITGLQNSNQLVHAAADPWNAVALDPAGGYVAGSQLLNAGRLLRRTFALAADGQTLQQSTLQLNNGSMQSQDLFPQIVNLQAFYGRDTNNDGVVDTYDNTTPADNAGWRRVLAVRLALVARSAAYQKEEVTTAQPLWDVGSGAQVAGSEDCGQSKCLTLKIDGLVDWKHYRYAVYDVIVPLRNRFWWSN